MLAINVIETACRNGIGVTDCIRSKKDVTLRLSVDYRKLNAVTNHDVYLITHMDKCINPPGDATLFLALDADSR